MSATTHRFKQMSATTLGKRADQHHLSLGALNGVIGVAHTEFLRLERNMGVGGVLTLTKNRA